MVEVVKVVQGEMHGRGHLRTWGSMSAFVVLQQQQGVGKESVVAWRPPTRGTPGQGEGQQGRPSHGSSIGRRPTREERLRDLLPLEVTRAAHVHVARSRGRTGDVAPVTWRGDRGIGVLNSTGSWRR